MPTKLHVITSEWTPGSDLKGHQHTRQSDYRLADIKDQMVNEGVFRIVFVSENMVMHPLHTIQRVWTS